VHSVQMDGTNWGDLSSQLLGLGTLVLDGQHLGGGASEAHVLIRFLLSALHELLSGLHCRPGGGFL